jgi:hypothetical protein
MSWQLWVLIAAAANSLLLVLAVKVRRAQKVFDRIVEAPTTDDLARHRRRRQQQPLRPALATPAAHPQHRSRGHH